MNIFSEYRCRDIFFSSSEKRFFLLAVDKNSSFLTEHSGLSLRSPTRLRCRSGTIYHWVELIWPQPRNRHQKSEKFNQKWKAFLHSSISLKIARIAINQWVFGTRDQKMWVWMNFGKIYPLQCSLFVILHQKTKLCKYTAKRGLHICQNTQDFPSCRITCPSLRARKRRSVHKDLSMPTHKISVFCPARRSCFHSFQLWHRDIVVRHLRIMDIICLLTNHCQKNKIDEKSLFVYVM